MSEMKKTQGKCPKCKVAYRWPTKHDYLGNIQLKNSHCMECKTKLKPTSHLLQWPWLEAMVVAYAKGRKEFYIGVSV